jgi:hypothetical protein
MIPLSAGTTTAYDTELLLYAGVSAVVVFLLAVAIIHTTRLLIRLVMSVVMLALLSALAAILAWVGWQLFLGQSPQEQLKEDLQRPMEGFRDVSDGALDLSGGAESEEVEPGGR